MSSPSQISVQELEKQRLYHWLRRASRQLVSYIQVIVAFSVLLLVVLLRIPWSSAILRHIGLTDSGAAIQSAVTVVVVAIFFEVRALSDKGSRPVDVRHFRDPIDVYPILLERVSAITRPEEKTIDVIGMTLYTAWPSIRFWLNRSELNGWTVRMAAVVDGEERLSTHVPAYWFQDSRTNLNDILRYSTSQSIAANRIRLEAYGYDFMPVLHGYRLGNGDLFYSLLLWDDTDGTISLDGYSYEFVPAEDRSSSAEAIRGVFDSWFRRVTRNRWTDANVGR